MSNHIIKLLVFLLGMPLFYTAQVVQAAETSDKTAAGIVEGGRLYDKWWKEMGIAKPDTTHLAYPSAGKKKGATTWRCKECHGWDYRGRVGAYAKGSHFTGIKGIRSKDGAAVDSIVAILKDKTHRFDTVLGADELKKLALFVSKGQVDMDRFIERKSKKVNGNISHGRTIYGENCARCHGDDGRNINVHYGGEPEYIGTVGKKNPWEALHKIRFGQPGATIGHRQMHSGGMMMHKGKVRMWEKMPFMYGVLTDQEQRDLLAYIATLPVK